MKLRNILNPAVITTDVKGADKESVIKELLDLLVEAREIPSDKTEQVYEDLMEREKKMSTGIQHGVAIPHAKTKVVKNLVACIGIKRDGVDFAALDGEPSRIFIMTLSPVDRVGPHVQFLAEISMVIKEESARKALLEARTEKDVLAVFGL
ncbi:MAG: PTS sugar transporter subunit IIA [Sphaerochaetaceae bacterium]|nr:PTS sugar transporter subunit IIA [Sphaerochaetaceae bacterium]